MSDVAQFIAARKMATRRALLGRFGAYAGTIPPRIAESLLKYVSANQTPEGTWSSNSILGSQTFALRNALAGIGPGTTAHVETTPRGVVATAGVDPNIIKHAAIHEAGGFIASKGSTHKYFWARFIADKLPWYRIMALSVMKKGGITIKKRSFMGPGSRDAIQRLQREMPDEIAAIVLAGWES